mgnify:CR=1 FL=1|jgi:hypothetical protein
MKNETVTFLITAMCSLGIFGSASATAGAFDGAIRPVSNPVFSDSPDVGTSVHPFFMYNALPDVVNTELGALPVGGQYEVIAVQVEVALSDTFSIIAVKDGYIDFEADETLSSDESGIGDIAAGVKWVFHKDEEAGLLFSARTVIELPLGDDDVWQGNGDGTIAPAVSVLKIAGKSQVVGTLGFIQPFDTGAESSEFYTAWHLSHALTDRVSPLVELNYFRVISEGDGETQFSNHVDGGVPGVAQFEGGDLVNLGASNADKNEDLVTLAAGARVRVTDSIDLGGVYEIPLTDDENSLMDHRITVDAVFRF